MNEQPSLFDDAAAARADGMQRAWDHADADWRVLAFDTIVAYLRENEEFFCDDLWDHTDLPFPREGRALGPVIVKVSKAGHMVKTDGYRPSKRSNLTAKPVWRSLIWTGSR